MIITVGGKLKDSSTTRVLVYQSLGRVSVYRYTEVLIT
jgi:hypothetical protein